MSKLNKFLTKNEITSLKNLQKIIYENQITVTCIGLYNHGKSTLLNVLIKDFEDKTFKTAPIRETISNKEVIYNDIKYIDTPGLNAKLKDDKQVMKAIENSDITLFVHNVNTGEFNKAEIIFLQQIQKHWKNPKEFIDRTIFVLSQIDESNDKDIIEEASKRMKEQIKNIFNSNALIIPVSSNLYKEGLIENEEEFISESNIQELENKIKLLSKKSKEEIIKTKRERFEKKYWELYQKLNTKLKKNQQEIQELEEEKNKRDIEFKRDISQIEITLKSMYARLS